MLKNYFHSVCLDSKKCQGCVTCIRLCPTEAIRVRNGKAQITKSWCIDCGECIRVCPSNAKLAVTNDLQDIATYKYNIALPAPALYSQFPTNIAIEKILAGIVKLGFDDVFEVARGAELVSMAIRKSLQSEKNILKPIISSACPAVLRLVQVKFPELIAHLSTLDPPVETAAKVARIQAGKKLGLQPDEIGTWFLTPCPAKMTSVHAPISIEKSNISGAIAINKIYGLLRRAIAELPPGQIIERQASWVGFGWGVIGGESAAVETDSLIVDGIHNVIDALEQVSLGKFKNTGHIEVLACSGGCTGGALLVENRHVAEYRLKQRVKQNMAANANKTSAQILAANPPEEDIEINEKKIPVEPKPILVLDEDIDKALEKLDNVAKTLDSLPGLDCGSCGSPSCKSLAEDIVQGQAFATNCVFILRQKVGELAQEMVHLSSKLPPPLVKDLDKNEK